MTSSFKAVGKRFLVFFLALTVVFAMGGWNAIPSYAEAKYTHDDTLITIVDKAGNDVTLAKWTHSEPNEDGQGTFIDNATNEEVEIIKDFTQPENQTGEAYPSGETYDVSEYGCIPYAGMQGAYVANRIVTSVTVKGILIEDLIDYAEGLEEDSIDLRGDTGLGVKAGHDGHGDLFAYDEYYSIPRYYYPKFMSTVKAPAEGSNKGTFDTEGGIIVPNTLALLGYNDSGEVNIADMIASADAKNSWRNFVGLADGDTYGVSITDSTNPNYRTMGARSTTGITKISFAPVYNDISVAGGETSGTAGEDMSVSTTGATVSTDDNYFKAANGEEVVLTVKAKKNYALNGITVKDAEDKDIEVEAEGDEYTFDMPETAVTVTVDTAEDFCEFGEDGFCTKHGEYDPDAASYKVSSADNLKAIADAVNSGDDLEGKTVSLTSDIDLDSFENWTPIGNADNAFAGTFKGNGKTISNLHITSAAGGYKGLFGNNGSKGQIDDFEITGNIGSESAYITSGSDNLGGAAGYNDGVVSSVKSDVQIFVNGGIYAVGGVVGQNGDEGLVSGCYNVADIHASKASGGVVGRNFGTISRCKNSGDITGNQGGKDGIGGIAGYGGDKNSTYENSIEYCYNTGTITNNNGRWHGGIAGFADSATTVTNCYDVGQITPGYSWNWNPIIGHVDSAYSTVHDNYSVEGLNAGDSTAATKPLTIGTVKSKAEMYSSDFVAEINGSGTAFKASCGYPVLDWEEPSGHDYGEDGFCQVCGAYNKDAESYTVSTASQLKAIADAVNSGDDLEGKTVTLANDIALDENGKYTKSNGTFGTPSWPMTSDYYTVNDDAAIWTPIGTGTSNANSVTEQYAFAGTFDGAGHTVSGLYTDADSTVQGLFGCLHGTVKDVTVQGCINAKEVAGGIAAYVNGGTIENCKNEAPVFASGGQQADSGLENGTKRAGAVGGIAGNMNTGSSVKGCTNTAPIVCGNTSKGGRTGGIIGLIDGANMEVAIENNFNSGQIDSYQYAGGIVGANFSKSADIVNCANTGAINAYSGGSAYAGGIVSQVASNITNCYNTGDVNIINNGKASHMGGICSNLNDSSKKITNCFNLGKVGELASQKSSYGVIAGTGYGSATSGIVNNCYYLDTLDGEDAEALSAAENAITAKTAAQFDDKSFVALINGDGDAYQTSCGYPVFTWQEAKEHQMVKTDAKDPACEENGNIEFWTCSECGFIFADENADTMITEEDTVIPALGHDYDLGVITKQPTDTEDGEITYTCSRCGGTYTEAIDMEYMAGIEALKDEVTDKVITANQDLATGEYTEDSVEALKAAIKAANDIIDDETATEASIKAAKAELMQAWRTMEPVDKAAKQEIADYIAAYDSLLETMINVYNNVTPSAYTTGSYAVLQLAMNEAEALIDDPDADSSLLAAAKTDILLAQKNLIKKYANTMTVKTAAKTVKFKKVKAKKQVVKAITVKKAKGKVTYTKAGGSAKLTVNKTTGKITVKKGTKKGTYKAKVKVKAAGNGNYKALTKTVTVTIKVIK